MPVYRYQLIADIEVTAPNIMAAERAIRTKNSYEGGIPGIRGFGSYIGCARLPSQRRDEPSCMVKVKVDYGKIRRKQKK